MKYLAVVEIEYETIGDPLDDLHRILERAALKTQEHYHIVEQPRELK